MKAILADCPVGSIVRVEGDWGVVCRASVIDLWVGGRVQFWPWTLVELPKRRKP